MELFIVGEGKVRLGQQEFVAQGGEACVYARGERAFKLYHDPASMLPPAKIQELSVLTHPCVIRPQAVLLDARNRPVGYTMRHVKEAWVLCQLFNRSFRERQGVTPEAMIGLVRKLQAGVEHVHRNGVLIVDLNEMNFLLDRSLREVLFIDVDSYQTAGFPATALMDSVRDRHARAFSRETDWFSFAIVSFQMFVGIHPYRGKHPTMPDLDARMQRNVSVLNAQVAVPKSCYPFSVIPPAFLEWYQALFEEGKRLSPPTDLRPVVTLVPRVEHLPGSDRLQIRKIHQFPAEIIAAVPLAGGPAALTAEGFYVGSRKHPLGPNVQFGLTPRLRHLVAAWIEDGRVALYDVNESRRLEVELAGEALTACDGRLIVKAGSSLSELQFIELPAGIRCALQSIGNAAENATRLFEGVAIQSLLGACYASLFPKPGCCYPLHLPELDGYRIVDARFENNVLMVVGTREGRYDRLVFRFDAAYRGYDVRTVSQISFAGLNFVVLENGVCVHLNENEELELFLNRMGAQELKQISDAAVHGARLFKSGTQLLFSLGDTLFQMRMRE